MPVQWWPAPAGGEAPDLPADQLKPNVARSLRNFLVHLDGRVIPRGNLGGTTSTQIGSLIDTTNGGALLGAAVADDDLVVSYRAPSGGPLVDYSRVPINRPTVAGDLSQPSLGATAGRAVNLTTGTVTDIATADPRSTFAGRLTRCDQSLYGVSFGGTSTAIATGVAPLNNIRKVAIGGSGVVLTNGPLFVQDVMTHMGAVFALAARTPGGADYDTSLLHWTNPGGTTALTDVATDWVDPVTGEANKLSVGAANDGDFGVGLGRARGHLLVFKRNAIYVLYGTNPSNFTLRQLRTHMGCVDARSICVTDEGTYFASQRGFELFDGDQFHLLSQPVADTWLALSNAGVASSTVNHAYIRADALPNGYLHLALGTDSTVANANDGTAKAWLFHAPTGAFIETLTAIPSLKLGASGYLNRVLMTRGHVVAFGAAKWALADGLVYGPDSTLGVQDRDASASYSVDLTWQTGLANVGNRWSTAQLSRHTADYYQAFVNNTPADGATFGTVLGKDCSDSTIVPSFNLPGRRTPARTRNRPTHDTMHEAPLGDVCLTFASNIGASSSLRTGSLELYGMGLEFKPGRARHLT